MDKTKVIILGSCVSRVSMLNGNLQGAHFENEFYHETFQTIQYIMKEKPKQKVWDRPDFFTNKKVQAEGALDIEDAFIKFEQLIEKEDILWMNILDKLHQRIPDDARVKEYVKLCLE